MKAKKVRIIAAVSCCMLAITGIPVSAMPSDVGGVQNSIPDTEVYQDPVYEELYETMYATAAANVRRTVNGYIIGKLEKGKEYTVLGRAGDWFRIEGYDYGGYVYSDYLTWTPPETAKKKEPAVKMVKMDIMMQASTDVNMRTEPNGKIAGVLKKGKDIHVTGNRTDIYWYRCEYKGKTVYVYDDYLDPDFPQTMTATHAVNVRTGPSVNDSIQGCLNIGEKVKVSAETNEWYKFTYEKTKKVGYAYSDYLSATN